MYRFLTTALLYIFMLASVSCAFSPAQPVLDQTLKAPRWRISTKATYSLGTRFTDANQLGQHRYESSRVEKNGIIYTCRGGHIDLAHLRKAADWSAFLAERTYLHLLEERTDFTFKFYEPSIYHVQIAYPSDWSSLTAEEKERIAHDLSIDAGAYFSHVGMTWHEILTWYDYGITRVTPSFSSSFSWEDAYSNALGNYLAAIALRDEERDFDEAMTVALHREVESLGPQSKRTSQQLSKAMRGQWYTVKALFIVDMKARNLDIGLDDGLVSPWLVPSVQECPDAMPKAYPSQSADVLDQYGIKIKLEIDPVVEEKLEILQAVDPDGPAENARIAPRVHFPAIMAKIRSEVEQLYGPDLLNGPGV